MHTPRSSFLRVVLALFVSALVASVASAFPVRVNVSAENAEATLSGYFVYETSTPSSSLSNSYYGAVTDLQMVLVRKSDGTKFFSEFAPGNGSVIFTGSSSFTLLLLPSPVTPGSPLFPTFELRGVEGAVLAPALPLEAMQFPNGMFRVPGFGSSFEATVSVIPENDPSVRIAELEARVAQLEAQLAEAIAELQALEAENTALTARNTELADALTEAKQAALEAQNELAGLKKNLVFAQQTIAKLETTVTALQSERDALAAQNAELLVAFRDAKAAALEAQRENAVLRKQLAVSAQTIAALTAERDSLAAQNAELLQSFNDAKAAALEAQRENASLRKQLAVTQATLAQVTAERDAAVAQVAPLTSGLKTLGGTLGATFGNPAYQIPGATPVDQLQALTNAIKSLNRGQQQALYDQLTGRK